MNKLETKKDLDESTKKLLDLLYEVPEPIFNAVPGEGGWTIGQVTEHLIKVETGTVRLFSGPVKEAGRDPREKIDEIKNKFLNFDNKLKAIGPIVPSDSPKDKTKALEKIQDIRQKLTSLIEIQDMTALVTGFEHWLFGPLTRVEWVYFNIYHSRRHGHQIKTIHTRL